MHIPKIKFREMTLQENIDLIKWAYFEDDEALEVHTYTIEYFPESSKIDDTLSQQEIEKIIEKIVTKTYEKHKKQIEIDIKRYNDLWKDYNDKYFIELEKYLNIKWPHNIEIIDANVGFIPAFPRSLDEFAFSMGTGVDDLKLIETCAHETLHFFI
jgi:hypothetical protein